MELIYSLTMQSNLGLRNTHHLCFITPPAPALPRTKSKREWFNHKLWKANMWTREEAYVLFLLRDVLESIRKKTPTGELVSFFPSPVRALGTRVVQVSLELSSSSEGLWVKYHAVYFSKFLPHLVALKSQSWESAFPKYFWKHNFTFRIPGFL